MSKLSDALEELRDARDECAETVGHVESLIAAARREHDDHNHADHFRWCARPVCMAVRELTDEYEYAA
jgi:hypothetical protein